MRNSPFSVSFTLPGFFDYVIIAIMSACVLIVLFVRRRKGKTQIVDSAVQEPPPASKPKGIPIAKVEVTDDNVKFFVAKGILKKKWIVLKEIPVYEITNIENNGNNLSVTWKDVTDTFSISENGESFGKLRDQVIRMLETQRKSNEEYEKITLRGNEMLRLISFSLNIIDLSFDVLIGLQKKRINWQNLEGYTTGGFEENLNFTAKTMPPLNLNFLNISAAVKMQVPKEISKEAYNILKIIYEYFNGLSPDDELKSVPNIKNAKAIIFAYYTLNDLLLGKIVGDKENPKENSQLDTFLQDLANETNVKVNLGELKATIDKMTLEIDKENAVEDSREIFKEQLKQLG